MALFSKDPKKKSFDAALLETLRCHPPKPRRKSGKVSDRGLVKFTLYCSPRERAAIKDLSSENGVNESTAVRALLRMVLDVEVDTEE
jgi:hypothetical protein